MRIGIVPDLTGTGGGVYQYSLAMMHALSSAGKNRDDHLIVFASEPDHPALTSFSGQRWSVTSLSPAQRQRNILDTVGKLVGEGPHREAWRWLRRRAQRSSLSRQPKLPHPDRVRYRSDFKRWFRSHGVGLMIYPAPTSLSFETEIAYLISIHDLQHRLQPEFSEVSANGEWQRREYLFRNVCRYATLVIADSEVGKEDILEFYGPYGMTPDKVKVLPFIPATYLTFDIPETERQRVRAAYDLPDRYLFYPAQFWPHKNHFRLVQALGMLRQEYRLEVPIVFCGSHEGEVRERMIKEVVALSANLGLEQYVRFLGYVPDRDMSGLYAGAEALVMPTFFGPTNIPVLEAWRFGCPVLTSDIRGIREQAGDAAVLVDPRSVESIAEGIHRLWTDQSLRSRLSTLGQRRLSSYTANDFRARLLQIVEEAKTRVRAKAH